MFQSTQFLVTTEQPDSNRLLSKDEAIFLRSCVKAHLDFYAELLSTGKGSEKSRAQFVEMSKLDEKLKAYL